MFELDTRKTRIILFEVYDLESGHFTHCTTGQWGMGPSERIGLPSVRLPIRDTKIINVKF